MGCPDRNINKQGSGSALIKTPSLAKEIIIATKEGSGNMPVSVKTRIGFSKNEIETWLPKIIEARPEVITIHGRTRKEMSKVPTHWDIIKRGVLVAKGSSIIIIGNGDVSSVEDGREKAEKSGVDGIMIGRAIFGNPWIFNPLINKKDLTIKEILSVMLEHAKLYDKFFKGSKSFLQMRKHMGSYVKGFSGAKDLRNMLMEASSIKDVEIIISPYVK